MKGRQDVSLWIKPTGDVSHYEWLVPNIHRLLLDTYANFKYTYNHKAIVF